MSVIMTGMEFPKACLFCRFVSCFNCNATDDFIEDYTKKNDNCPLKSIGGLIEKIEQLPTIEDSEGQDRYMAYDVLRTIKEYCEVENDNKRND